MKQIQLFSRIRANFWLLVSTVAALCLFFLPVKLTILLEGAIFLLVLLSCFLWEPSAGKQKHALLPAVLAVVFAAVGCLTFYNAWSKSSILAAIAGMIGLPVTLLAALIGLIGAVASLYAFRRLACWIDRRIGQFLPEPQDSTLRNLKANWYFVLSAGCFFCMAHNGTQLYSYSIPVAVVILAMVAGKLPSVWQTALKARPGIRVLAAVNAMGICRWLWVAFQTNWTLLHNTPAPAAFVIGSVAAFPFAAICVTVFWSWLWSQLSVSDGLRRMSRREWLVVGGLYLALAALTVAAFTSSEAFYGTEFPYDLIYTSDSPILVQNNAYLSLSYEENDLRQPLFALFAAPFMGIPSLISGLFSLSAAGNAIVMNLAQIGLLLLTLVLLSEVLELSGTKRILFLLLGFVSYPFLLFTLMMEQYIVACFYLVLFFFLLREEKDGRIALWGAGGTLLTSIILLPAVCRNHPLKKTADWLAELYDRAIEFVILMLAFCRADIILDVVYSLQRLSGFSDNVLSWGERFFRFTQFVRSCVLVPPADSLHNAKGILSWQLVPAVAPDWIGVGILALCLISAVANRKKFIARIAGLWVGFSVVILLLMGWGAPENGQILYCLYFGWAFVVLLYLLAERIGALLKKPALATVLTVLLTVALALANFPAIRTLMAFATAVYPL